MSNQSQDHTSIRVHAPPGGQSNNIFGTSEFEQSAANKKKQSASNIFGTNQDNADPAPVKQTRNAGNNIVASDSQEAAPSAGTLAGRYKQTQMKSNIFGTDEPTSTRAVSDKNKSNIFGVGDNNDPNKHQSGGIRRDPNASRMGYNPINGESYNANSKPNGNEKQPESTVTTPAESNGNGQAAAPATTNPAENNSAQAVPAENNSAQAEPAKNGSAQAPPANAAGSNNSQKVDDAQKGVHTSVRVFHPPGGRSNGPLW